MSFLIEALGGAIKAVGPVRTALRTLGLDTSALDELHGALSGARTHTKVERVHDLAANAGAGQAAQPADPGDAGDGDPADADDGFISDVTQWITNLFN